MDIAFESQCSRPKSLVSRGSGALGPSKGAFQRRETLPENVSIL